MWFVEHLTSASGKKPLKNRTDEYIEFEDGVRYPIAGGIPITISENNSLFSINEIIAQKPQTQDKKYADQRNLKNLIRRSWLPALSLDKEFHNRYRSLAEKAKGGKVLIIGAGDKIQYYKDTFSKSYVVTSDVHLQFGTDIVFDAHEIPFPADFFDLIIAGQVLEHTVRPWQVSRELQRVSVKGGIIQIEVPFAFPYHAAPYDFFRFTFSGLRSLFNSCRVIEYKATEGAFAATAIAGSQALMNLFSMKYLKYGMLVLSRFLFFWLKYLDLFKKGKNLSDFMLPKGFYITFQKDEYLRNDAECLGDFKLLVKK